MHSEFDRLIAAGRAARAESARTRAAVLAAQAEDNRAAETLRAAERQMAAFIAKQVEVDGG